jgi:zinc transporter
MTDAAQAAVPSSSAFPVFQAQPLPGLVFVVRFRLDGTSEELKIDQPIVEAGDDWLWLHFNLTDPRCVALLKARPGLPEPARALLVAAEEHQQLEADDHCVYGIFSDLVCSLDGATEDIGFMHFAMTENVFLTSRRHPLNAVEATRKALRAGLKIGSPTALLEAIVQQLVNAVAHHAENLAAHLDTIEERIAADNVSESRRTLGQVRRTSVRLHRQLVITRSLMHQFEHQGELSSWPDLRDGIERLGQRLAWLDAEIVALRDRAHLLQEETLLKNAEQTNRNLQVLAIVSTLFLPASLVAAVFGMNFDNIPFGHDRGGFGWALILLVAISGALFWLLRRLGLFRL